VATADTRPRWRVNAPSFIGHSLCQEGDEVFYTPPATTDDGVESSVAENLSPLNDAAQAVVDKQKRDHPDKTDRREKVQAKKAALTAEAEAKADTDGPVKRKVGDTRSPKAAKAPKEKPTPEPAPSADDDLA